MSRSVHMYWPTPTPVLTLFSTPSFLPNSGEDSVLTGVDSKKAYRKLKKRQRVFHFFERSLINMLKYLIFAILILNWFLIRRILWHSVYLNCCSPKNFRLFSVSISDVCLSDLFSLQNNVVHLICSVF